MQSLFYLVLILLLMEDILSNFSDRNCEEKLDWVSPMLLCSVIPDRRPLVFLNMLIQVSACIADIIRIAQIPFKMCNALLIHNRRLLFFCVDLASDPVLLVYTGGISVPVFRLSSQVAFAQEGLISGP